MTSAMPLPHVPLTLVCDSCTTAQPSLAMIHRTPCEWLALRIRYVAKWRSMCMVHTRAVCVRKCVWRAFGRQVRRDLLRQRQLRRRQRCGAGFLGLVGCHRLTVVRGSNPHRNAALNGHVRFTLS